MICDQFLEPQYLVFTSAVPELLYYSHIPATAAALLVGIFVFINGPKLLLNRLLMMISLCFSVWTFANIILWTNIHSDFLLFVWSLLGIAQSLMAILSIYFIYVFLFQKDVRPQVKLIFLLLLAPVLLLSTTDINLSGYNITECDAFGYEGILFSYCSALGILAFVWILALLVKNYRTADRAFKKQIMLMGIGMEFFLLSFFVIVYLATYLTEVGILHDSAIEMYALFGMTIFMVLISVLIVRFKTFHVALLASQALVISLLILVGSQFTYTTTLTTTVLTSISLVLTGVIGIILIRSVKKEVQQRKQIEVLAGDLARANERLRELDKMKSEFVSIASHQLRSPLTAMRGYASMLAEGSFGKLPEKAMEAASRIDESAKLMILSVEDYLNVSRIEAGNMKYNLSDFNVKEMVEHICDDIRPEAMKKNLVLLFRSDISGRGVVNADVGKTSQIIHNLINNSLKYTPKGSINVFVHDDMVKKRIYISITDTGIGMSEATAHTLFQKFSRADNANSVNVSGTGLGLYVALKMAEQMGGTISCESEGDGKGSTFTFELPLVV